MTTVRNLAVPAVFVILRRGSETFFMRRMNTGWADGQWTLPSGHVEKDETARQAAARELKEETGIDVPEDELRFAHSLYRMGTYQGSPAHRIDLFFELSPSVMPVNAEPEKCDQVMWCVKPPEETLGFVQRVLDRIDLGLRYSEDGWE